MTNHATIAKLLTIYNEGMKFYKSRSFDKALSCFEACIEIDANDGPSKVYVDRCKFYMDNPPPENWDGVYTMTTK